MVVQPDLLDHPKFLAFKKWIGGLAAEYLIRLWGHCQELRKGENWGKADSDYVETVCDWKGEPGKLFAALEKQCCGKPGWIHRNEQGDLIVTNWEKHNKYLIKNWESGERRVRPQMDLENLKKGPFRQNMSATISKTREPTSF